jgi:hypothetical protein
MKKKLKVEKASFGKIMKVATAQGKKVIGPQRPILGRPPTIGPKSSAVVNPVRPGGGILGNIAEYMKQVIKPGSLGLPPRPPGTVPGSGAGTVLPGQINPFGPGGLPIGGYGSQQPGRQSVSVATPIGGGVGDPRLGAATIPGNQAQMQMRNPTQAAPVQPVPAMKKGGMVRGQGAAIRGTKFKGIF